MPLIYMAGGMDDSAVGAINQFLNELKPLIKQYATEQIKKDRERLLAYKGYTDIQGHGILDFVELCHFDQPITLD